MNRAPCEIVSSWWRLPGDFSERANELSAPETSVLVLKIAGGSLGADPAIVASIEPASRRGTLHRRKAVILVLLCTVIGAGAQMLLKLGSAAVETESLALLFWSMAFNWPLILGLGLYGLSMVLFVHALRNEQLSLLYPLISLTYIWVMLLSILFLKESISVWKVAGVLVIVLGVACLGRDNSKL